MPTTDALPSDTGLAGRVRIGNNSSEISWPNSYALEAGPNVTFLCYAAAQGIGDFQYLVAFQVGVSFGDNWEGGIFTIPGGLEYNFGQFGHVADSVVNLTDRTGWHMFGLTIQSGVTNGTVNWFDGAPLSGTATCTLIGSGGVIRYGKATDYGPLYTNAAVEMVAIYDRALTADDMQAWAQNRYQMLTRERRMAFFDFGVSAALVFQYGRPISDIAANGWLPSIGSDLYAMLDESVVDDSDYIYSPENPSTQQFEVKLTALADPVSSSGHTIRIRLQAINADTNFDLALVQGTTVLDSWTENVTLAAGAVTRTRALSGAVIDSISDYSNLRVRGVARE